MPTLCAPISRMFTSILCWFPSIASTRLFSSTTIRTYFLFCCCRSTVRWSCSLYTPWGRGFRQTEALGWWRDLIWVLVCGCVSLFIWFCGDHSQLWSSSPRTVRSGGNTFNSTMEYLWMSTHAKMSGLHKHYVTQSGLFRLQGLCWLFNHVFSGAVNSTSLIKSEEIHFLTILL